MDDLPVKRPAPFYQKITSSCKTLDFYLRLLLLLLENVKHNQILTQHCPMKTESGVFPNFTSEAGSAFSFKLPIPATDMQHHQLSLANGSSTLPHWMVFRRQTGSLSGLALTEDCGIYNLKVSVIGEQCPAYFYLHIQNRTARDYTLSCPEREMTIWANLLLLLNPATLDASQRIHLVSTMADYLRLPVGFVYLFSSSKSFIQQENLRVCRQGGLAEKITGGTDQQDASGNVAELLWPVGCQGEERQSDLATVLEYSMKAEGLAGCLEAPVLGWRVLCAPGRVRRKVKRDMQRFKFTPTPNMIVSPPTQVHQIVKPEHSHIYSLPSTKLEPSLLTILLHMDQVSTRLELTYTVDSSENTVIPVSKNAPKKAFKFASEGQDFEMLMSQKHINQVGLSISNTKPLEETTGCSEQVSETTSQSISEYFQTTEAFPSPVLPEHIVRTFVAALSSLQPSSTLHNINLAVPLTPASYSVTSTLTHEAVGRKSLTTRLTLRPHQKEIPLRTGAYRASRTDSESQPTVSSLGQIIYNQEPIQDQRTAKPTLYNLPSVSHPPPTEKYNDIPLLSPTLKTPQSLPPSNEIPSTRLFPDVSPASTVRLSTAQHSDTIKHLSSVLNQDVMSQLNVTTQDTSSAASSGQLTLSGQTELESSLSMSSFEPSVLTFTPALPSELDFFSRQHETSNIINVAFTLESLKASSFTTPSLQTFSKSLPPDIGVTSWQKSPESQLVTSLQSKSDMELYFHQNSLKQTLSAMSLQSRYPLQISLSFSKTFSDPLSMFKNEPFQEQPPESVQSKPSMQQTLHTLPIEMSQQTDMLSHKFLISTGIPTISYVITAAGPRVTSLSISDSTRLVFEDHFDPTAPSTVQEPNTTPFIQMHDLDPSFPLCGQSVALGHVYVNGCTPQIKSTDSENTVENFLDSYSQNVEYWTARPSRFFKFASTQTSRTFLSMHPLPSEVRSNEFMSSLFMSKMHLFATTEINHPTATPQMDISATLPVLEDTGSSVITSTSLAPNTSALSGNCISWNPLLICPSSVTDSSGPITKGRPTQQILSTSLSLSHHEVSSAFLTSLQVVGLSSYRRESSVQPTSSSSTMNLPPKVLQSIPVLMATVGFPFHYSIPPKTFLDPEDGDANALSLEISLIDGPPISIGTWLALDGLELHGVPLEVDLQFAPQHLLLAARDGQGLSTWLPLTMDLRRSPVNPCHVFTLTAQRSLHSVLRRRHRVELLLRKLSGFFNSSSSHHLSVVSLRPGSTVVSWYNYSLCGMGYSRVIGCNIDQIQSMWLAMRSADGSVNPAFREAMLPEFPVTKVGPVSFRQDCFPTTSPPIFDGTTPAVHTTPTPNLNTNTSHSPPTNTCTISAPPAVTSTSQQNYQWMAGMFTALLVVCLLILIVLIVASVLHFCKCRERSRTVAIWPAGRVLSVQSRDLTAIRPRRPPLLHPEVPPPPLRLWISLSQSDERQVPPTREQVRKPVDKSLQPRFLQYDFSSI